MDEKGINMVKTAVQKLQKTYGKESVTFLGNDDIEQIPRVSSECLAIDEVTGGGYPLGRIIEVFGGESSGKTTTCNHAIAAFQKAFPDRPCAFIDSEFSYDKKYARQCGVNTSELVIAQPDSGEDAFAILQGLVEADFACVVVDSVAAMVPRSEVDNDYDSNSIGAQARMISKGLRKITSVIGRHKTTVIFTNQIREKVGVVYGNPETTPGGHALKFYASIRLKLTPAGYVTGSDQVKTSVRVRVEAVKNKTAAPYKRAEFIITFGKGIDDDGSFIETILKKNLITVKGAGWYAYEGKSVAQGIPRLRAWLEENPDIFNSLKEKVLNMGATDDDEDAVESEVADDTEVGEV